MAPITAPVAPQPQAAPAAPKQGATLTLEQIGAAYKAKYNNPTMSKISDWMMGAKVVNDTRQNNPDAPGLKMLPQSEMSRIPQNLDEHLKLLAQAFKDQQNPPPEPTGGTNPADYTKDYIPNPVNWIPTIPAIAPAQQGDDAVTAGLKTIANFPGSAFNFAKGLVNFINPIEAANKVIGAVNEFSDNAKQKGAGQTLKDLAVNTPGAAYQVLVPRFLQQLFSGDTESAGDTIANDPVGQIAPLVLLAQGMAEKAGYGEEFNSTISKIAGKPAEMIAKAGGKVGEAAKTVTAKVIGTSTGAGSEAVKSAMNASPEFTAAMRGKTTPEDVVRNATQMFGDIRTARRQQYLSDFANVKEWNTKSADIAPLRTELQTQLKAFGVKETIDPDTKQPTLDFSRSSIANSGPARADIKGVWSTIKDWGSKQGDRNVIGLDTLKKQLDDFYSDSSEARAFVQAMGSKVRGILKDNFTGYEDMTKNYQQTTQLLNEIKSATGVGGKAGYDTIFTKLTRALKTDNEFRDQILNKFDKATGKNLKDQIAGINMSDLKPRSGLVALGDVSAIVGTIAHVLSPQTLIALLSTSPRVMGEFFRGLGMTAGKAEILAKSIKSYAAQLPKSAVAAGTTAQDNQQ